MKWFFYVTCIVVCLLAVALYFMPTQPALLRIGDTISDTITKRDEKWETKKVWAGENQTKSEIYTIPDGWTYVTHEVAEDGKIGDAQLSASPKEDGKRVVAVAITAKAGGRDGAFGARPSIGGILSVKIRRDVLTTQKRPATAEDVSKFRERLGIKTLYDEIVWRAKNNAVVGVALILFSVLSAVLGVWLQILKLVEKKKSD